ncbi:serine/threonine protein kinase [Calothrix rhizosoleniae]|uniref:serine/threonine protein kinase n=1 Tax=Calothrix rhizosoleniae TaxID=888997 RepID=UPI000B49BB73|nr:serine/threonine-protein kinase [Calothrix rhizosoleniae]
MLQPEQILENRYQLQSQLGNNGIRQTWLAKDLQAADIVNQQVVVKLLAFGGTVQWEDLKLFEREAQILKQLSHPRIPKYIDYFSIDDRTLWFCLVEQYIPGDSLKDKLAQKTRFTEKQVRKIAVEVLNTLIYLHNLSPTVLHRDIKPSNLIWGEDNQIYVVDFGAVQDKAAKEGVTFTVVGTYGYAPMEQFGGKAVPASDLYALGATLIHLLTGISPGDLPQRDLRMQFSELVNPRSIFVVSWLQKMIEPAPEKRFSSAREALTALKSGLVINSRTADAGLQPTKFINNSGCGINNQSEIVPEEIIGWNWGAFFMPWLWLFPNRVWWGLLSFIPHIGWAMAIFMGAKGNEWAWKSRYWRSIQQFKAHQRGWAIAGILLGLPFSLILWCIAIVAMFGIIT